MTGDDDDRSIYERAESGDLNDEEAQAHNEQRRQEIQDHLDTLNEQQQEAVATLRESAQESADTEMVTLPSGVDLEVRSRIPPAVESLIDDLQTAEQHGDPDRVRRLNSEALAEMVVTEEYSDPRVWVTASKDGDAGLQWLAEVTDIVLGPATEQIEDLQGNSQDSSTTRKQTTGKQSGWQRQR